MKKLRNSGTNRKYCKINIHGLNSPVKKQRFSELKKKKSRCVLFIRITLEIYIQRNVNVQRRKSIYIIKSNEVKAGVIILRSNKTDRKAKRHYNW